MESAGQPGGPPLSDSFAGPNSGAFPPLDAKTARLNASDYPTLGAGTRQTSEFASSRPARTMSEPQHRHRHDHGRNWQEDERDSRFGAKWYTTYTTLVICLSYVLSAFGSRIVLCCHVRSGTVKTRKTSDMLTEA
eukprot:scaffold173396_cov27-Prasinocladus_malaysianus.AAC.1